MTGTDRAKAVDTPDTTLAAITRGVHVRPRKGETTTLFEFGKPDPFGLDVGIEELCRGSGSRPERCGWEWEETGSIVEVGSEG